MLIMNVLVFKIETIPDIEAGQKIFNLEGLDDKSTAKAMFHMHQQKTGSTFLPLYLQKIIALSVVYRGMGEDMDHEVSVRSLGDKQSTEVDLLNAFFKEIEERTPALVSWNGSEFDLPIMRYRTLKHAISMPNDWEKSDQNTSQQYADVSSSHTALKNALASYNHNANAPLNDMAIMLGFPGKMGMDGSQVWDAYQAGKLTEIRNYCETDVLNTYLIYLRYQLMRGELTHEELEQEYTLLRDVLDSRTQLESESQNNTRNNEQTHLGAFSKVW